MIFACSHSRCRRLARHAAALLCCAIVIGVSGTGRAYQQYGVSAGRTTIKLKWNRMPVQYYVRNAGATNVSANQIQAAIEASFATWHGVATAEVSAQFVGFTGAVPGDDDGLSVLGFLSRPDEPDVLGETNWLIDDVTGEIVESDIFFNTAGIPWSVAATGETGRFDLQSIATHEIGHLFGLGHSALGETTQLTGGRRVDAKASVMFPIAYSTGSTVDRKLQPDDIAGMSDLYPAGGFRADTGSVSGRVTKNGQGVFGAHVVAFSPTSGALVGNFTQNSNGAFTISGLAPGPVVVEAPRRAARPVGRIQVRRRPGQKVPNGLRPARLSRVAEALADVLEAPAASPAMAASKPRPAAPQGGLTPEAIGAALALAQPEGAIVVDESATTGLGWFYPAATGPRHTLLTLTGGAIGMGPACAVGAAIACPDRPVVNFQGDGGAMYTLQSLWTQAREQLHVVTLICANRAYKILQVELERAGSQPGPKARALTDLANPALDWVQLAGGMGVPATRVETAEGLAEALARALAEPGPHLVEMVV